MKTHPVTWSVKEKVARLKKKYWVGISSGRSMEFLDKEWGWLMDEKFCLQGEIGNFINYGGEIAEEVWTEEEQALVAAVKEKLADLKDEWIRGFEPKRKIITLHAKARIEKAEEIVRELDTQGQLYCWWNGEAYDIGLKRLNKGTGVKKWVEEMLKLPMNTVLTVGNGVNDQKTRELVGMTATTNETEFLGDLVYQGEELGGERLLDKLLELV